MKKVELHRNMQKGCHYFAFDFFKRWNIRIKMTEGTVQMNLNTSFMQFY